MERNTWITVPGNQAAQAFLAQYPTPRALREALKTSPLTTIIPEALQALVACYPDADARTLLAHIAEAAIDHQVWVSNTGHMTII